jgi:hypothetical protein
VNRNILIYLSVLIVIGLEEYSNIQSQMSDDGTWNLTTYDILNISITSFALILDLFQIYFINGLIQNWTRQSEKGALRTGKASFNVL